MRGLPLFGKTLCLGNLGLRHPNGHVVPGLFRLLDPFCRRKRKPHQSGDVIPPYSFPALMTYPETCLSAVEALFCGFLEPLGCLGKIGSVPGSFRQWVRGALATAESQRR